MRVARDKLTAGAARVRRGRRDDINPGRTRLDVVYARRPRRREDSRKDLEVVVFSK